MFSRVGVVRVGLRVGLIAATMSLLATAPSFAGYVLTAKDKAEMRLCVPAGGMTTERTRDPAFHACFQRITRNIIVERNDLTLQVLVASCGLPSYIQILDELPKSMADCYERAATPFVQSMLNQLMSYALSLD